MGATDGGEKREITYHDGVYTKAGQLYDKSIVNISQVLNSEWDRLDSAKDLWPTLKFHDFTRKA